MGHCGQGCSSTCPPLAWRRLRRFSGIACYASLNRFSDAHLVGAEVRRALQAGFTSLKLHETEILTVEAARDVAGPDVQLTLDVNCAWTFNEARTQACKLEGIPLKWLEEPIWPPEDHEGLARLRKSCRIPIAAGEIVSTQLEFERLMVSQAVDFV